MFRWPKSILQTDRRLAPSINVAFETSIWRVEIEAGSQKTATVGVRNTQFTPRVIISAARLFECPSGERNAQCATETERGENLGNREVEDI